MNHFKNQAAKIDYTVLPGSGSLFVDSPTGHVAIPSEDWERLAKMLYRAGWERAERRYKEEVKARIRDRVVGSGGMIRTDGPLPPPKDFGR